MACAEYEKGALSSMKGVQSHEVSATYGVVQGRETKPNGNELNFIHSALPR